MTRDFTICVLLYGDYPDLAERCLKPLTMLPSGQVELRVGANSISLATHKVVDRLLGRGGVELRNWYPSEDNLHKYPMMRIMLHDPRNPVTTPFVMWFDDDSFILNPDGWLDSVAAAMKDVQFIGSPRFIQWQGNQREWVKHQPWYNNKDVTNRRRITFFQGGWWCARRELLETYDYPWPCLDHRGGDVMLGEMLFQQDVPRGNWSHGVAINADHSGKADASLRRGFDSKPIGFDFDPNAKAPTIPLLEALQRNALLPAPPPLKPKRRIFELGLE